MKQSAKRITSMLLALLFLAAAFVLFFDLLQPAYGQVQTLRGQLLAEQNSLGSAKSVVKQVQDLVTAYDNQSQGQGSVGLALPTGEDVAGAVTQIEGIAQNQNLGLTGITVGSPALASSAGASAAAKASSSAQIVKPMGSFALKLTGSASYESIKNFLSQIETNIRIFDVEGISIVPVTPPGTVVQKGAPASRDLFNYEISVQAYYQLP